VYATCASLLKKPVTTSSSCVKWSPAAPTASYGIEGRAAGRVCRPAVIERAREVLKLHEKSEQAVTGELKPSPEASASTTSSPPLNHNIAERHSPTQAGRAPPHRSPATA